MSAKSFYGLMKPILLVDTKVRTLDDREFNMLKLNFGQSAANLSSQQSSIVKKLVEKRNKMNNFDNKV